MKNMTARDAALDALTACRKDLSYSDEAIRRVLSCAQLDARDSALASRLFYSVLQNRILLDFYIDRFYQGKQSSLHPAVRDILRLGIVQLLFFDKIPDSAAVNEAVKQTKRRANIQAAGLVNGILRTFIRQIDELPVPESLSVRYSCPEELLELLQKTVGDELLEPLLRAQNEAPEVTVQVNLLKISAEALISVLETEGVIASKYPGLDNFLSLKLNGDITALSSYCEGLFFVQDPASYLSILAASPKPGMKVLDCCAAPGGKSFTAAIMMQNSGSVISCDIHQHKKALVETGAARLGIDIIDFSVRDASELDPSCLSSFDIVICDVPCSGLGVIRKKPDIRYKSINEIKRLPAVQSKILEVQSNYVKLGGILLYSTCTVLADENENVTDRFLELHPEYHMEAVDLPIVGTINGNKTLLPCVNGTDGFYFCKMRKDNDA